MNPRPARFGSVLAPEIVVRSAASALAALVVLAAAGPARSSLFAAGDADLSPPAPALAAAGSSGGGEPEMDLLSKLVVIPGVSGREENVRAAILADLPDWARKAAKTDAMGNLIVTIGSGSPSVLYVAHMDEIGYVVTNVRPDGMLQLQKIGGFYDRQYEGQVVVVHASKGDVIGVVVIPSTHLRRDASDKAGELSVENMLVDLGTDSRKETEALGVALLDPITIRKTVSRLAGTRFAARSMDDRFGCAAILAAARRIQAGDVKGTVTFAWSTQEEVGLRGAAALAEEMTPDVAVSVDSFVTSDSPIESHRLADEPLGEGPVIRALDSSYIAPIALVRSLLDFAKSKSLPLSYGATMGGNDGSMFHSGRTRVLPLAIPIRYSHSAVETIDSKDQVGLVNLLEAMMRDVSWAR